MSILRKSTILVFLLGTLLGLLVGTGLRGTWRHCSAWMGGGEPSARAADAPISDAFAGLSLERSTRVDHEEALKRAGRTERWLWLATRAETASPREMPRLVRLAAGDSELMRMLGARWAELDPHHMLASLMEDLSLSERTLTDGASLIRDLLRDWGEKAPQDLAEALSDDSAWVGYEAFRWTGVDAIMRQDPALGLRLMTEWDVTSYTPSLKSVGKWAARDPAGAAHAIAQLTNDHAREEAMKILGEVWATEDPRAALDQAADLEGAPRDELAAAVMEHWAESDLQKALAYADDLNDPALLAALSGPLVEAWAKTDAASALLWSQENLPAPARIRAIGALVKAVTEEDVQAGVALVDALPPGQGKSQATVGLLANWVRESDLDVQELGRWLDAIDDERVRTRALNSAQWEWVREHPETARAFLESEHGHFADDGMIRQVLSDEVRTDPRAALDWAQGLEGDLGERARRLVVEQWMNVQPDAAIQWATQEAAGEAKVRAIEGISRSLVFAGEERLRAWSEALTADERRIARQSLDEMRLAEKHAQVVTRVFGE